MLVMPNDDLVLLGQSLDTSLMTLTAGTARRFLAYFSNDPSILNYKWAVQLPSSIDTYTYRSIDFNDDTPSS